MKFIKLLLLLVVTPSIAFALNEYDLLVNTPQEVDMFAALLEGIHYFFHGTTGENYLSLLRTIFLFGTVMTMIKTTGAIAGGASGSGAVGASSLLGVASYQIFVVFMLTTLFARESQLIIKHPESLTFDISATIPDIFGFTISFFSGLNYKMTAIAEESFSDIRGQSTGQIYDVNSYGENIGYGMTGLGYGGMPVSLSKVSAKRLDELVTSDGRTLSPMFKAYAKDCIVMPLSINNPIMAVAILNQPNFFENILPSAIATLAGVSETTMIADYGGNLMPCQALYDKIIVIKKEVEDNLYKRHSKEMSSLYFANYMQQGSFSGGVFGSTATTGLIKDSAVIRDQFLNQAMSEEYKGVYAEFGKEGNVFTGSMSAALAETQRTGMASGVFMAAILPVFASFIFMVMIASFPFMFAFSLMPGGFQIMVQFIKTLAWVSLWSPMAAVLNFFIDYRMIQQWKEKAFFDNAQTLIGDQLPNPQMVDLSSEAATMAGLAGYLYLMVPGLSWMLVTGSGVMLGNMTGALGGSFQSKASGAAMGEHATEAQIGKGLSGGAEVGSEERNTAVAEAAHYSSGAKMAQASAAYKGQKETYGDDFDAMASDQGKQVAQQHGQSIGAGSMMTMSGAAAGGQVQGKFTGASTQAMGEMGASRADSMYKEQGQVSAGKQMAAVDGAHDQLAEHGGAEGLASDGAAGLRMGAQQEHASATEFNKDVSGHRAGLQKQTAQKMGATTEIGNNEYSTDDYRGAGEQSARTEAHSTMKNTEAISKESDERLKKTAEVDANARITATNAAVNDSGVSVDAQKKDAVTMAESKVQTTRANIQQHDGSGETDGSDSFKETQVGATKASASKSMADFKQYGTDSGSGDISTMNNRADRDSKESGEQAKVAGHEIKDKLEKMSEEYKGAVTNEEKDAVAAKMNKYLPKDKQIPLHSETATDEKAKAKALSNVKTSQMKALSYINEKLEDMGEELEQEEEVANGPAGHKRHAASKKISKLKQKIKKLKNSRDILESSMAAYGDLQNENATNIDVATDATDAAQSKALNRYSKESYAKGGAAMALASSSKVLGTGEALNNSGSGANFMNGNVENTATQATANTSLGNMISQNGGSNQVGNVQATGQMMNINQQASGQNFLNSAGVSPTEFAKKQGLNQASQSFAEIIAKEQSGGAILAQASKLSPNRDFFSLTGGSTSSIVAANAVSSTSNFMAKSVGSDGTVATITANSNGAVTNIALNKNSDIVKSARQSVDQANSEINAEIVKHGDTERMFSHAYMVEGGKKVVEIGFDISPAGRATKSLKSPKGGGHKGAIDAYKAGW